MNSEHVYLLLGIIVAGFMLIKKLRKNRIATSKNKAAITSVQTHLAVTEKIEKQESAEVGLGNVTLSKTLISIIQKNIFLGIFILLILLTGVPMLFLDGFLDGGLDTGLKHAIPLTIAALIMAAVFAIFFFIHKCLGPKAAVIFGVLAFVGIPSAFVFYVITIWG